MSSRGDSSHKLIRIIEGIEPTQMTEAKLGLAMPVYESRKLQYTQLNNEHSQLTAHQFQLPPTQNIFDVKTEKLTLAHSFTSVSSSRLGQQIKLGQTSNAGEDLASRMLENQTTFTDNEDDDSQNPEEKLVVRSKKFSKPKAKVFGAKINTWRGS